MSLRPNCTCRPGLDDVITPKVGPVLVLGAPRIGVLVRLMNWVRNSKFVLSEIWNALTMLRSEVANPGPRNAPAAQVPNVPGFASVTDAGFRKWGPNTPGVVGSLGFVNWPLPDCETPGTQFGRGEALPVNDLSGP